MNFTVTISISVKVSAGDDSRCEFAPNSMYNELFSGLTVCL
jgi:hypothetical protein